MKQKLIEMLLQKSSELSGLSKKISESTQHIAAIGEETMGYAERILASCTETIDDMQPMAKSNVGIRDQYYIVLNSLTNIYCIIERQTLLINSPPAESIDARMLTKIKYRIAKLGESLQFGLSIIQNLVRYHTESMLLQSFVREKKRSQLEQLKKIKTMIAQLRQEAKAGVEDAAQESRKNQFFHESAQSAFAAGDTPPHAVQRLINEIAVSRSAVLKMKKSAAACQNGIDNLSQNVSALYEDTMALTADVDAMHRLYEKILEHNAELTVVLSLELNEYNKIREPIYNIREDTALPPATQRTVQDFNIYASFSFDIIENLLALSRDFADILGHNARLENELAEGAHRELKYIDTLYGMTQLLDKTAGALNDELGRLPGIIDLIIANLNQLID